MRKKTLLFLVIILGLLLVPSVLAQTAGGPMEKLEEIFDGIVSVGQLGWLDVTPEAKLVGFMRILIGIVIFSLLFMSFRLLSDKISGFEVPRNISVTISVVMAIVSSIFLPAAILTAIGTAYAAAVAFVLLGSLIAAGLWLLLGTETETRAVALIKLGMVLFMTWLIGNIEAHALAIGGTYFANPTGFSQLGSFGNMISFMTTYAYVILICLMVWLIWKVIAPGDSSSGTLGSGSSSSSGSGRGWFSNKLAHAPNVGHMTDDGKHLRLKRTAETANLNNLAAEEKEKELLEKALDNWEQYKHVLADMKNNHRIKNQVQLAELQDKFDKAEKVMDELNGYEHRFRRAQRRESIEIKRLLKKMKKRGINDPIRIQLETDEQQLLGHYAEVKKQVDKANQCFEKIKDHQNDINHAGNQLYGYTTNDKNNPLNFNPAAFPTTSEKSYINIIIAAVGEVDKATAILHHLSNAITRENLAIPLVIKLADDFKRHWKI